jgi:hypothetical protein
VNLFAHLRTACCATVLLTLVACSSSRPDLSKDPIPPPWPEAGAPQRLLILAEDLQTYLAETGRLPTTLTVMDDVHLAKGGPYADLGYVYHPAGIAFLRDGWRLIAVDDRRAEAGKVWCVVRPAVRVASSPRFRIVLVTVAELRESAAGEP